MGLLIATWYLVMASVFYFAPQHKSLGAALTTWIVILSFVAG